MAGDIAFQATNDLCFAQSLLGSAKHICLGSLVVAQPDHDDAVEGCICLTVSTAVQPVPPEEAGIGFTPHSAAKAASEWRRSGLLPAVTSGVAAVSCPMIVKLMVSVKFLGLFPSAVWHSPREDDNGTREHERRKQGT